MVYQNKGFDPGLNPSFINLWRKEYLEDEWPWEWQEYMGAVSWTRWEAWNLLCNIQRERYAERAIRLAQFEVVSNFLGSLHQFRCVIIYPLGSPSHKRLGLEAQHLGSCLSLLPSSHMFFGAKEQDITDLPLFFKDYTSIPRLNQFALLKTNRRDKGMSYLALYQYMETGPGLVKMEIIVFL